MKTSLTAAILLAATLIGLAQATSPRSITKKVVERQREQQRQAGEAADSKPAPAPPAATKPLSTNAAPAVAVRPKTKEELQASDKKALEFQKQRAQAGSASAQYDLGMRYLNGNGVEKNLDEAKQWFEKSAAQGNSMATKKLEELKQSKP
jgi:TPR repeat protein